MCLLAVVCGSIGTYNSEVATLHPPQWASPAVLEFGSGRVEREIAALALEIARLWEELAKFSLSIGLCSTPPQDMILLLCELGAPLLVRFLHKPETQARRRRLRHQLISSPAQAK